VICINRIQRALLQKEKKGRAQKRSLSRSVLSLFLSRNAPLLRFVVRVSVVLRQLCASTLSEKWGKRETTKRNERKKERKERKKGRILNPKKLFF
jgi:hypothetical protein